MDPQALAHLHPAVREWFVSQFGAPTDVQERGWASIAAGQHTLLGAPTGSGKTLAAFLHCLSELVSHPQPPAGERLRLVYISPLRALNYDIERNLRAPLVGIAHQAAQLGLDIPELTVGVRTGDTPQSERARQRRRPPDILITTPESLYVMLTSGARELFTGVRWVIVDEVHALASTKRGTHLAITLERLAARTEYEPQRIALSATQRPIERVARFVGGVGRDVTIIESPPTKQYDIQVRVPVDDMAAAGMRIPTDLSELDEPTSNADGYSIWGALHSELLDLIGDHRSTIVFVNSRRLAERIALSLNELAARRAVAAGADENEVAVEDRGILEVSAGGVAGLAQTAVQYTVARAHHGSVSRESRREMEDSLKRGELPAIIATSSLELGIDMGAVDLVVHIEAPKSVSGGIQRIGRAGHGVGEVSTGRIFPKHRRDLVECAAVAEAIAHRDIEPVRIPERALDVLAQQIIAIGSEGPIAVADLAALIERADPYRDLSREQLDNLLNLLSGAFPADELAELKPRIIWDRTADTIEARSDAARIAITNAGTIPDRGLFGVFLAGGGARVGELDEEMVHETRIGDVIVLGATSWRVEEITRDRVLVSPVPGAIGRTPFWHGEGAGRTVGLGERVGAVVRRVSELDQRPADGETEDWADAPVADCVVAELCSTYHLDDRAARNLVRYVREQRCATGALPTDKSIVIERFRDELGDWRICIHTPWGKGVHAPWAMAIEYTIAAEYGLEVHAQWGDDGITLRAPDMGQELPLSALIPAGEDVEQQVVAVLGSTGLFASRFREVATRALLLPLGRPGQRAPLWLQRLRSHDMLKVAQGHPSFPMILETYRECLSDVFDLDALRSVLGRVEDGTIGVRDVTVAAPSPFAAALLFDYTAGMLYESDQPAAERRAQTLALDLALLRDLLGTGELRDLLDLAAVEQVAGELQRTSSERRARSADGVHDLLRGLGDLTRVEIAERTVGEADALVDELVAARRIVAVSIAGGERLIASEDAGLVRDALGVALPAGIPDAFLTQTERPLERLILRYAATRGPVTAQQVAERYDISVQSAEVALAHLAELGDLLQGQFLPGGSETEWCAPLVLKRIRAVTLAALRKEIEPIDPPTLVRFLHDWQHLARPMPGDEDAVLDVIAQFEGIMLPPDAWERDILQPRIAGYSSAWLAHIVSSGRAVWVCTGTRNGQPLVSFFTRENFALMAPDPQELSEDAADAVRVLDELQHGAVFADELAERMSLSGARMRQALWELAMAGRVTCDSWRVARNGPPRRRVAGSDAMPTVPARRTSARVRRASRSGVRSAQQAAATSIDGRWSVLSPRRAAADERLRAAAEGLLECYGIVTRAIVQSRSIPGGFAALYRELSAMEHVGAVRRGYFVEGLGGAQFALPEVVERIRSHRMAEQTETYVVQATDPAQPYGAILPWPESIGEGSGLPTPQRAVGRYVVLHGGMPVATLAPRSGVLNVLDLNALPNIARALADLVLQRRFDQLQIERINGASVTPIEIGAFAGTGFVRTPRGVRASAETIRAERSESVGPRGGRAPNPGHGVARPTHGRRPWRRGPGA